MINVTTRRYFTFGQIHMTNYPLPKNIGGRLADYWITVEAKQGHRHYFITYFTKHYCPSPSQFAYEYTEDEFDPSYFPNGQLCLITKTGIQKDSASCPV